MRVNNVYADNTTTVVVSTVSAALALIAFIFVYQFIR